MEFPREVPHGLPVSELTKEFNKAVRVLRALRPVSSTTVRVESVSNGTTFHARPEASPRTSRATAAAAPRNLSFMAEARKSGTGANMKVEVKMLGGTAQGLFGPLQAFPTIYWKRGSGNLELFDDYDSNLDDLYRNQTLPDGTWFWLEWSPDNEEWTLEKGADLPASSTVADAEDARYFTVFPLFRLRLSEASAGTVQMHLGAVYVPTCSNVVDVQDRVEEEEEGE